MRVGFTYEGKPVYAQDLGAVGAMAALLRQAFLPNLVQTAEGNPAFIHMGPFGNIAHGTNSLRASLFALGLADYVVQEAGFATDLGMEKFMNVVARAGGLVHAPSLGPWGQRPVRATLQHACASQRSWAR